MTHDDLIAIRDQFFALSRQGTDGDKKAFRDTVSALDASPAVSLDGLGLSFHPTARHKSVRFIPADKIPESHRELFARPSTAMPDLAAAFVDPEEFSYRTFENIVPLDRHFHAPLDVTMSKTARLGDEREPLGFTYRLNADAATQRALLGLDSLGLYVDPLNAGSRGGRRFIFHSNRLANALTKAASDALPAKWRKHFSHVNPVFRCNRFEPRDAPFAPHVDTPYYDAQRKHVSRYTLLVYLTGGEGDGTLRFSDDVSLDAIDEFTCVLFRQDQPHQGAPYHAGRKLFLRTELIFEDADVAHDETVAQTFAKACYLTGESVFAPELARYTHELYDRAALAHWRTVDATADQNEPVIHKRFRGVDFVTNGYDFWFSSGHLTAAECAAIAVLDVLNGKVFGDVFRKQCERLVEQRDAPPSTWVPALLREAQASAEAPFTPIQTPIDALFPESEEVDEQMCCPFHCYESWNATRNGEIVDLHERAQQWTKRRLDEAPIVLMGQELFLNPENFVIENGKIHVLADRALAPVNFAACWNDESVPGNYLAVEATLHAPHLVVPPILFRERDGVFHLMVDLFRNSWMIQTKERAIPVPRVTEAIYEDDAFQSPWLQAAGAGLSLDLDEDDIYDPWWLDDDAEAPEYA